jgi:thiol-disulfide isomerase/thioredoxin
LAKLKAPEKIASSRNATTLAALMLLLGLAQASWAGDWNLKSRDGVDYTLSGLHGKWVLVNFWAPWCPPCLQEMPDLNASQQQHKDLQVIGVAVMYVSRKKVIDVVNKQSISYPIVFGNEDTAGDFGGLDGLPTSFLYTPSGKLVGHHQGILTQSDLDQAMAQNPDATILFTR